MEQITLDPAALQRLEAIHGAAEILNSSGRVIGVFRAVNETISPTERAELESRRKDRSGKLLRDVIDGLRK
jgi:hypothetical protein